jgi:hypothetical protein
MMKTKTKTATKVATKKAAPKAKPVAAQKATARKALKAMAKELDGKTLGSAPAPAAAAPAPAPAAVTAPKAPKPGVPMKDLIKAVRAHSVKFAHQNGWDIIVASWSDEQIATAIVDTKSKRAAIATMRIIAKGLDAKRPAAERPVKAPKTAKAPKARGAKAQAAAVAAAAVAPVVAVAETPKEAPAK